MEIWQSNYDSTLFSNSLLSTWKSTHHSLIMRTGKRSKWWRSLWVSTFSFTQEVENAQWKHLETYHQYHLPFLLVQSPQKNIALDGRTLDTFDQTKVHENHLLKFLTPDSDFLEMFPPKIFNRVSFQVNACPQGCVTSQPCEIDQVQPKILCLNEVNNKDGQRRAILSIYFTLPTKDHIANYFLLMKSNEMARGNKTYLTKSRIYSWEQERSSQYIV